MVPSVIMQYLRRDVDGLLLQIDPMIRTTELVRREFVVAVSQIRLPSEGRDPPMSVNSARS